MIEAWVVRLKQDLCPAEQQKERDPNKDKHGKAKARLKRMDCIEEDNQNGCTAQNVGRIPFGKPKPHNQRRRDANEVAANA